MATAQHIIDRAYSKTGIKTDETAIEASEAAIALDVDTPQIDTPFTFPKVVDESKVIVVIVWEQHVSLDPIMTPRFRSSDQSVKSRVGRRHPENHAVVGIARVDGCNGTRIIDIPPVHTGFKIIPKDLPLLRTLHGGESDGCKCQQS